MYDTIILHQVLLHLTPEEVCSVEITNPTELGTAITDKTFILDIKVSLNSYIIINLELQVINQHDWTDRSLSYLCRNFDNLHAGENYQNVRPVIQIGLLIFPFFPNFQNSMQHINYLMLKIILYIVTNCSFPCQT